jgi:hypothetical protein
LEKTWTEGIQAKGIEECIWIHERGSSMKKEKTTKTEAPL